MTHRAALATTLCLCALAAIPAGASAAAPTIPHTTLSNTATTSTTLEADVNPQSKATKYHFEYGPSECSANPCTSTPEVQIPSGTAPIRVSAPIEALTAGTTYHFRAVARHTNEENGETASPDRTFMTYLEPQEFDPCPNDHLRLENPAAERIEYSSANLPDCRAYEQATPINKDGGDAVGMVSYERASTAGSAITYLSMSGSPGGVGSQQIPVFLASRGAEGWTSRGLLPPARFGPQGDVQAWTPDFSHVYTKASLLDPVSTAFLDGAGPLTTTQIAPYVPQLDPDVAATSKDGEQVLFESDAAIPGVLSSLQGKGNTYIWDRQSNQLRLAGVMNDGQAPINGTIAGPYDWTAGTSPTTLSRGGTKSKYYTQDQHVLAADGSAAYFTAAGTGQLYQRRNPLAPQSALDPQGNCTEPAKACTIQLNATHKKNGKGAGGSDPAGAAPAALMGASTDGTKALFTSSEMLTDDANTGPEQEPPAVVRSDLDGTPASIGNTFIPTHATGVAVDAEHVYWVDSQTGMIGRANLDGSEVDNQFITATEDPKGIAVANGYIYWTNGACDPEKCVPEKKGEDGTIGKAKLNGDEPASEVDQSFVSAVRNPWAVAASADYVYWASSALAFGASPENHAQLLTYIGKAHSDGTEQSRHLIEPFEGVALTGLAIDSSHIYWAEVDHLENIGHSAIQRANLDGSGFAHAGSFVIIGVTGTDRTRNVRAIAVQSNYIYWAAQGTSEIGRVSLDGKDGSGNYFPTNDELEFIKGAGHPYGIAADASHLYWSSNGEASPNPGNDLYRYDAKAKPNEALVDLAPDSTDPNGAEVRGVLGTSADSSYVYFVANGVLDGVANSPNGNGESAEPGHCRVSFVDTTPAKCNLYLAHAGSITFIAQLETGGNSDNGDWADSIYARGVIASEKAARVTHDGRTLLFGFEDSLYRYRVGESAPTCVSCDPSGESAGGGRFFGSTRTPTLIPNEPAATLTHNLSTDGNRVFFETTASLVTPDTNGLGGCPRAGTPLQEWRACTDVYEWEAEGSGSCDAAHAVAEGGCIYLISTGKGTEPALIADASPDGTDVFFFTRSRLVGQDADTQVDVYDARLGGGLVAQNQPPPPQCENEGCKEALPPVPLHVSPSSDHFAGKPDPVPNRPRCHKPKVRRNGRCVKKSRRGSRPARTDHDRGGNAR